MARPSPKEPPKDLNKRPLPLVQKRNQTWIRISLKTDLNPIHWSKKGLHRFDSPEAMYGVLYIGDSLECSMLEVFGDRWIGNALGGSKDRPLYIGCQ